MSTTPAPVLREQFHRACEHLRLARGFIRLLTAGDPDGHWADKFDLDILDAMDNLREYARRIGLKPKVPADTPPTNAPNARQGV
jgi:hypothetical protein